MNMINFCFLCDTELNSSNSSDEHIIPNCVGGKLTSPILHTSCNSNAGGDIDGKAFKELEFFTNFLNPSRSRRRKNQPITLKIDGEEVRRSADGDLQPEKLIRKDEKGNLSIKLFYRPNSPQKKAQIDEAKQHIKNLGNKKGLSSERIDEIIENFQNELETKSETINNPEFTTSFNFDKDGSLFLGLLKIAIGYAVYSGCDKKDLEKSIKILKEKNNKENHANIAWHYPDNLYPKDSIYHSLVLVGDANNKLLYCFISLYGVIRVFVMLNDCYEGGDFIKNYFHDIRNQEVRENSVINFVRIQRDDISKILSTDKHYHSSYRDALSGFMDFFCVYPQEKFFEAIQAKCESSINEVAAESKIVLKEEDFRTEFRKKFYSNIATSRELKILKKTDIEGLIKAYEGHDYKSYIDILLPQIIAHLIGEVSKKVTSNYEVIKDKEKFKSAIIKEFSSITTDNEVVNLLLKEKHQEIAMEIERVVYESWENLKRVGVFS